MIVGEALGRLFKDMTVDLTVDRVERNDVPVQYHYGDHKELVKWVLSRDRYDNVKFPLIWYVVAPYRELNGVLYLESQLIIFQNTKLDWFNDERYVRTYSEIIEPVWQEAKKRITENSFITVEGANLRDKFLLKDEPSYGIDTSDVRLGANDFSRTSTKGDESIIPDYVDGRVIKFQFRIQPECIN